MPILIGKLKNFVKNFLQNLKLHNYIKFNYTVILNC